MWTKNFQIYKLDLQKAEEPEIKMPTSKCQKAREFQKNIWFIDYTKDFDCVDHNKLWKILQDMGIPDHITCLQNNLYIGQEATVRTRHGTKDWFKIGKGIHQGCILSLCLFNLYAEYIMWNAGLDEAQTGIKIARRSISITSTPLWQKIALQYCVGFCHTSTWTSCKYTYIPSLWNLLRTSQAIQAL